MESILIKELPLRSFQYESSVAKNLKTPPEYPTRRIPATTEKNSFFIDLKAIDATDQEVAEALEQVRGICGVRYRDDLRVVEVVFFTKEQRDDAVKEIIIEGKKSVFPVLPREHMPTIVYVRMANLPIHIAEEGIKISIKAHWSDYGKVLDIAAHKVHGKWLTHRWDVLLEVEKGKKLEAPVAFKISERPVVAAWPASPPSCLICIEAGHQAKKCPRKNPKAGGRLTLKTRLDKPLKWHGTQKRSRRQHRVPQHPAVEHPEPSQLPRKLHQRICNLVQQALK